FQRPVLGRELVAGTATEPAAAAAGQEGSDQRRAERDTRRGKLRLHCNSPWELKRPARAGCGIPATGPAPPGARVRHGWVRTTAAAAGAARPRTRPARRARP